MAQVKPLTRAGNWQAFSGTTGGSGAGAGKPLCGVAQATTDDSYFGIKTVPGLNGVVIQIGHKAWSITGDKAKVTIRFDSGKPWVRDASRMNFIGGDAGLEITLNRADFDNFSGEFRGGSKLLLQAEGMPDWTLDLAGSNAIASVFQDCIRTLR